MSDSESNTPVELYGPEDGGWYSTRVMDWIGLCDELRDAEVRTYLILRSLVIEKYKNPVRKLTLATLVRLIPGPNGKESSVSRVRAILDALSRVGLVSTPDGGPVKTSSRSGAALKPLRIRVNDMPPEGYQGWRNTEAKLAAILREDAAKSTEDAGQNSGPEPEPGAEPERAGQNSGPAGQNSSPRGQNSDPHPGSDLPKPELPLVPTLGSPTGGEAPSARSALGARSASSAGSRDAGEGGSAASSKSDPPPEEETGAAAETRGKAKKPGHSRAQLEQARAVCAFFPPELRVSLVQVLTDAILGALAGDVPNADRTVEQLGARIEQRWVQHGFASKFHAGELKSPVGAAVAMVRPLAAGDRYGCADPRCEAGVSVDTGEECRACAERIADRRAQRAAGDRPDAEPTPPLEPAKQAVPAPRGPAAQWWECDRCGNPGQGHAPAGGLCASCRASLALEEPAGAGAPF